MGIQGRWQLTVMQDDVLETDTARHRINTSTSHDWLDVYHCDYNASLPSLDRDRDISCRDRERDPPRVDTAST